MITLSARSWIVRLEDSFFAESIRQSLWLYPTVQVLHIVGIVLLVGSIILFDVRLVGLSRRISVKNLARHTLPIAKIGFILSIVSGFLLFSAHATDWISNPLFIIKSLLILLSIVNIFIFHTKFMVAVPTWKDDAIPPIAVRVIGWFSMVVWLLVVTAGRFLAYY